MWWRLAGAGYPMLTDAPFAPAELTLADVQAFADGNLVLTYDRS